MSSPGVFRQAAGSFASGVTVVTVHGHEGCYGITASSFASLSLNPLLVSVSINRSSPLLGYVRDAGAYAVSVLASHQENVAAYFARRGRVPEQGGFESVATTTYETGAPVIDGALSWFDCTVEDILPGGDHEILVGRVAAAGGGAGEPLVYWAGGYRALTAEDRSADRLSQAADGLSVALHLLEVDATEMLDAQRAVEPMLAALAARRGTAADWERLDALIDQSVAAVDNAEEFNQQALDFHAALAEVAGNRVLQATLASLGRIQTVHFRGLGDAESARRAIAAHRRLLAVLRRGDPEAARTEMLSHLGALRDQLRIS